jgi:hypothetical protein
MSQPVEPVEDGQLEHARAPLRHDEANMAAIDL